ncbi:MAG: SBBP repeat-containing protein [Ignavibacteriales bacterium]|nr:SBBP repeat-containing protein [Ignavibacteriales bacterium]
MKTLSLILTVLVCSISYGQWAKSIGGTSSDYANSMAVDGSGNVYVTGNYASTADFDPSGNTTNLTSAGGYDIYFAKYDANGALLWAKSAGGTGTDYGNSIAVDASGCIYVTGYFSGTANFAPSEGTANRTSAGSSDIFFAKYNANGNIMWVKSVGGTSGDYGNSIAVDASGNVYITGHFSGTADFDPSDNTTNLVSWVYSDIFCAKYDANGALLWANSAEGDSYDYGKSIAVDGSGNVYITGSFSSQAFFGTEYLFSTGSEDVFFAKYNSSGTIQWAKKVGGTNSEDCNSIIVDGSSNIYIAGGFQGTADFDPSAGTTNLTSAGSLDVFFAKYNYSGDLQWAKNISGTDYDIGNSTAVDGSGYVFVTGFFSGTTDFDPSGGTTNLTSAGSNDAFFAKYNSSGVLQWAKNVGGANDDRSQSISVDESGYTYIAGFFRETADFDPSAGTTNLTSAGVDDIFFAKYNTSDGLVPVELTSFSASIVNGKVVLIWSTATEVNNYGFEILRFAQNEKWEKIGFIQGHGNSNSTKDYTFTDNTPPSGKIKYRLKQIDFNGAFEYSNDIELDIALPTNFSLHQNYPNPFNPETTISYKIQAASQVSLKVYDILGREVATLVNEYKSAGSYNSQFSIRNYQLPSGVYFYTLKADTYVETRKMVLIK